MIAEVIINSNVKSLNRTFDYNIPIEMEDKINIGSRVLVKFGNIKKLEEGFVVNIKQATEFQVKDIIEVEEKEYIDTTKIELAKWMAETCFCNISDCIRLMLPPGTGNKDVSKRIKEKNLNFVHILIDANQLEELIKSIILVFFSISNSLPCTFIFTISINKLYLLSSSMTVQPNLSANSFTRSFL